MNEVKFTVPSEPKSKSRHRTGVRGGRVYHYKDDATTKAQAEVTAWYRRSAGPRVPNDRDGFTVIMDFHVQERQRRDVDNLVKLVLDGLTGAAWKDDSQVTEIHAKVIHQSDSPRSEVTVRQNEDLPDWSRATCEGCGQEFRTYQSWARRKYCTRECGTTHRRTQRTRSCAHCGEDFTSRDTGARYCSTECSQLGRTYEAECAHCSRKFRKPRSLRRGQRDYCDTECQASYWRGQRKESAKGKCETCGGGTSRKEYKRCNGCKLSGV